MADSKLCFLFFNALMSSELFSFFLLFYVLMCDGFVLVHTCILYQKTSVVYNTTLRLEYYEVRNKTVFFIIHTLLFSLVLRS